MNAWPGSLFLDEREKSMLQLSAELLGCLNGLYGMLDRFDSPGGNRRQNKLRLELSYAAVSLSRMPKLLFGKFALHRFEPYWLHSPLLTEDSLEVLQGVATIAELDIALRALEVDSRIRSLMDTGESNI